MTHEELLAKINHQADVWEEPMAKALRAVVELHKPYGSESKGFVCEFCMERALPAWVYPCSTIQSIEKELQ